MWGIGTLVLTVCHSRIKRELLCICLPIPPPPTPRDGTPARTEEGHGQPHDEAECGTNMS